MQAMLLRFLETGEIRPIGSVDRERRVDVRIIAAASRRLFEAVREQAFRADLFYRLNVIHVMIPPLRERREDIAMLAMHYLRAFSQQYQLSQCVLRPETLAHLREYDWPGNVRELKDVIERIVVTCEGGEVRIEDLPARFRPFRRVRARNEGALAPSCDVSRMSA